MKKSVNYRLPVELIEAMKVKAAEDFRSVNSMIEMVMTKHCADVEVTESVAKPKPARQNPADSHSSDLGDYASKYGKGQVKRGQE